MTIVVGRTPQHTATVVGMRQLTPRMRRVSLGGIALDARPGQDVELILSEGGRRLKRRYTVRNLRRDGFDIDAVLHGDPAGVEPGGPGARWAASVAIGDEVLLQGPRGRLVLADADWHLFVGDESALPAIAELAARVDQAIAVVEIADEPERQPLAARTVWVERAGRPAGTPDLLRAALGELSVPPGSGHGYLLGESRAMISLRPDLGGLGLEGERLYVKGYWNVGRSRAR